MNISLGKAHIGAWQWTDPILLGFSMRLGYCRENSVIHGKKNKSLHTMWVCLSTGEHWSRRGHIGDLNFLSVLSLLNGGTSKALRAGTEKKARHWDGGVPTAFRKGIEATCTYQNHCLGSRVPITIPLVSILTCKPSWLHPAIPDGVHSQSNLHNPRWISYVSVP